MLCYKLESEWSQAEIEICLWDTGIIMLAYFVFLEKTPHRSALDTILIGKCQ